MASTPGTRDQFFVPVEMHHGAGIQGQNHICSHWCQSIASTDVGSFEGGEQLAVADVNFREAGEKLLKGGVPRGMDAKETSQRKQCPIMSEMKSSSASILQLLISCIL